MSKIYAIVFIVNNLSIPVIFLHQADMDYHSCKNEDKNEAQKQIMACPWQEMTHYQQQHSQDEKCQAQVFQIILHTLLYIYVHDDAKVHIKIHIWHHLGQKTENWCFENINYVKWRHTLDDVLFILE